MSNAKGKLVYGFPSTGKTTYARDRNWFDTDYLLGKLRSTSTPAEKLATARCAEQLLNLGYSGVTNLTTIKPDVVYIRESADDVRALMKARGDDHSRVDSLPIEKWIDDVKRRLTAEWRDVPVVSLSSDKFISDHEY